MSNEPISFDPTNEQTTVSPPSESVNQGLRQKEDVFRLLVSSVKDYAIFMLDPEGYVMTWNEGAQRAKGYTADEIIGKHFSTFYTPEAQAAGYPARELETAKAEGRYEEEGWRVRKDGTLFWANVVVSPLYDSQKELVGFGKVTRDLTERKSAEIERSQSIKKEEIFSLLVSGVKDYAIFVLDPEGHVMTWNEGAQRAKGYSAQEIIGKHFSTFYTEEAKNSGHPQMELREAIALGRYEEEGWRVRKDGSMMWANVLITPLYFEEKLIGFAKLTRDLTERKKAQELEQETARLISETNAELQHLAYVISHELQAPVSTISRYCNLLRVRYKERLGVDADEFIDKITHGTTLVAGMIDDLWTYARINKPDLTHEMVSISNVVDDAIDELKDEAYGKQITHDELPPIQGNREQLTYLFKELLQNAIKYRSPEPPVVHIAARPDKDGWLFSVKDNGIGIDKVFANEIFKLFHRLIGGPDGAATGMGLAICRKIVARHQGRIWFESQPGQGTTFFIWLPGRS